MIYEPETLLMDEPFGALDAQLRLIMHDELLHLERTRQTIIFITHDLEEAITLAYRVAVMSAWPGMFASFRIFRSADRVIFIRLRRTQEFGELFRRSFGRVPQQEFRSGEDM